MKITSALFDISSFGNVLLIANVVLEPTLTLFKAWV